MPNLLLKSSIALTSWQSVMAFNNAEPMLKRLKTAALAFVTSVIRGSLYEKIGNKCMKILKFWRTELSYAQNKNRGKKMLRLGRGDILKS
jgi:hypothetical protein